MYDVYTYLYVYTTLPECSCWGRKGDEEIILCIRAGCKEGGGGEEVLERGASEPARRHRVCSFDMFSFHRGWLIRAILVPLGYVNSPPTPHQAPGIVDRAYHGMKKSKSEDHVLQGNLLFDKSMLCV